MKHVNVAMVLITNPAGKVLMALRGSNQTRPDMWELPGGRVERGETVEQAAVREAKEELGVDVIVGRLVAAISIELEVHFNMFCIAATIVGGEPKPLAAVRLGYLDLDDAIVHLPCVPSTYLFYKKIRDHLAQVAGKAPP